MIEKEGMLMNRRSRVGRCNRLIIDRIPENKPLYGSGVHEIYRSAPPIAAVRYAPSSPFPSSPSTTTTNNNNNNNSSATSTTLTSLSLSDPTSTYPTSKGYGRNNDRTTGNANAFAGVFEFNKCPPANPGIKRQYWEMMPSESSRTYCNIDPCFAFNMASEMTVHVDKVKRLFLTRNVANDQVQFFL